MRVDRRQTLVEDMNRKLWNHVRERLNESPNLQSLRALLARGMEWQTYNHFIDRMLPYDPGNRLEIRS